MFLSFNLFAQTPKLSNFRVEDSNKDRVYFDVSGDISGLTKQGFVISGKTISSINTSGNYFTVSSPFTFWDNNTIRLGENSDASNVSPILYNFTLSYIQNNIPEPLFTGTEYFVDGSVSSSGDGLTETTAFKTIQEGVNLARAGDKVWIKAFNYGDESVISSKGGNLNKPIIFEGYKDIIGDIDSNYYIPYSNNNDITSAPLDASEMPLIEKKNRNNGTGWGIKGAADYLIIKNIQIKNGNLGLGGNGGGYNYHKFERINIKDLGSDSVSDSGNAFSFTSAVSSSYNKFIDCIGVNASHAVFRIKGEFNLVENCKAYCDEYKSNPIKVSLESDYYIYISGSKNIIKNSVVDRRHSKGFGGHGYNAKKASTYNLFDNNVSINIAGAFVARQDASQFNVFKNNESHANVSYRRFTGSQPGGMNVQGGGSYNIWENNYIHHTNGAIVMTANTEQGSNSNMGIGNIWRNNLIHDVTRVINIRNVNTSKKAVNNSNKIYNNTIINASYLFNIDNNGSGMNISNNEFKNNIIQNVNNSYNESNLPITGYEIDYNNFYDGMPPLGSNFTSGNPYLDSNFKMTTSTSTSISEGGTVLPLVRYGKDGIERSNPYSLGAFQKKNDNSTGSINANAGSDQTICLGESITLTASGGSSYSWNTGATTKSITVNPNSTTTYTVTVSDGSASDSDTVQVTVNNVTADAGSDKTINQGDSVSLTANGGDTYVWNTGATTQSITVNPTSSINYTVTATKNGCEDEDSVQVTVNATTGSVTAYAGSDQIICLGENVILTASGGSSYSWNTGATTKSITVSPNSTTTYTVTVSDGSDSDSDTVQVTVNSVTANAGGNQSISAGGSVTLTASGGDSYVWNTGATTQSITVSPTATITYTVIAKRGDCEDTDTVQVTVNTATTVTANAGSDQSICLGESVTLTASGGSSYSWNTGATTKSITVNPNTTTTYMVTVSDGSVSDSDSVTIAVSSVTVDAGSDKTINQGDSVTLTANGGDSYVWNTGATTQSITVSPTATTSYTVIAKRGNCEDTDTVQVTVNAAATVTANAGSDQSICLGESVTLTASGGSSYSWNTGATTKSITVNPNTTTTYTVTVSEGSASDSDSVQVTVNSVTANAGPYKTINQGENVTLTASGGSTYLWSTGSTSKSITVSPQETQNYTLTAYKNGCEDTDTVQVTVNQNDTSPPPAKADAGEDQTICLGESIKLTASGGATYLWSTGETSKTINVNPTRTTTYTVTATRGGVTNSDTVDITVENCSAVSEAVKQEELLVYPNPSTGTISIKADNNFKSLHLNIYSMNGSIVYSDEVQTNNNVAYKSVDLSNLSKGVYIVRMYNADYHKTKRVLLF